MFLTEEQDLSVLRPASSLISSNDWSVLTRYWYPVAVAGDLKQAPLRGKLLDVELVIYRTEGRVTVALDRCPHRHIRLSAGEVVDNCIVCPFHGLSYNADGKCTRIPALGREASIPPRYRLQTFRSEVRYGLVWACLDEASTERVPEFQAATAADPDRLAYALVRDWPVSAPRQLENFIDLAHIPFVHAKSMGGDPQAAQPLGRVEQTERGVTLTDIVRDRRMPNGEIWQVDMTYELIMPFMVEMYSHSIRDGVRRLHMYNIPVPISAYESRVFMMFITPGPSPSKDSRPAHGDGDQIVLEDIELLGKLAQPLLPLDQKSEIHLPVDLISLEYRKRLKALGLGRA